MIELRGRRPHPNRHPHELRSGQPVVDEHEADQRRVVMLRARCEEDGLVGETQEREENDRRNEELDRELGEVEVLDVGGLGLGPVDDLEVRAAVLSRLDAEVLRDQALALSGLLVDQLGGPSVKPPQPDGLWKAVGYSGSNTVKFSADTGDKIYRRSVYTFWKRTAPPPQMSTFDAPSRESCTTRRERTNTPLQALLLMNDTTFVESARLLAAPTLSEHGTT